MVGGALIRTEENTLRVWCCDYSIVVFYEARSFRGKRRTLIEILYLPCAWYGRRHTDRTTQPLLMCVNFGFEYPNVW